MSATDSTVPAATLKDAPIAMPLSPGRQHSVNTYVERAGVDDRFRDAIAAGKHLIIFGSADTGKTTLTKHQLRDTPHIVVQCSSQMKLFDVYRLVLSEAGVQLTVNERRKKSKSLTATVDVATDSESDGIVQLRVAPQIDLANVRDILRLLEGQTRNRIIVLEDFHYLKWKVQRELAHDLKVAYESSNVVFVVSGVWSDTDRLSLLSGDLVGRSILIDAGRWQPKDLENVVLKQEKQFGRSLPPAVRDELINASMGCVGILAESTHRALRLLATGTTVQENDPAFVASVVSDMLGELSVSFSYFIERFWRRRREGRSRAAAAVMRQMLTTQFADLSAGLSKAQIVSPWASDPDDSPVNPNTVDKVLEGIEAFQRRRGVRPPILSFDRRRHILQIVDTRFVLFLKHIGAEENRGKIEEAFTEWVDSDGLDRTARIRQRQRNMTFDERRRLNAQRARERRLKAKEAAADSTTTSASVDTQVPTKPPAVETKAVAPAKPAKRPAANVPVGQVAPKPQSSIRKKRPGGKT